MERGREVAAGAPEQATLQTQVDYINTLGRRLDKTLMAVDIAMDRLTNRPPRAVGESAGNAPDQSRPSIEGALNLHASYLEGLVKHGEELLARLNRAV